MAGGHPGSASRGARGRLSAVDEIVTPVAREFRCSREAVAEHLAGTAPTDHAHLLVEYRRGWGRDALAESTWPEEVRHELATRAKAAGVRVQLIRRHEQAHQVPVRPAEAEAGRFVAFAAWARGGFPAPAPNPSTASAEPSAWVERTTLTDPADLLDLSLADLAAGRSLGWSPHHEPLLLVCTNGKRDVCCAEQGRPIARALSEAHPDRAWETTHVGGHRFAGAMLVLPGALSYGRLDVDSALRVAAASERHEVVVEHLRGRGTYPPAVQYAEAVVRRELGENRAQALLLSTIETDGATSEVTFQRAGSEITVQVRELPGPAVRASCRDAVAKPTTTFEVVHGPR